MLKFYPQPDLTDLVRGKERVEWQNRIFLKVIFKGFVPFLLSLDVH